jgi:ATP-dependent DNA ligase
MTYPINPPIKPMLAKPIAGVPAPDSIPGGLVYEPKWDGFRCIVFRDGDSIELGSRNEKPLTRYFPELVEELLRNVPERCVIDGEIVVVQGDRLDFAALQSRIHPAASRVNLLAHETPASFVAFDLLALDEDLTQLPFRHRRSELERALVAAQPPVYLTRISHYQTEGERWFQQFEGAGLDGIICKALDSPYQPDKRVMFKVKHSRTADCVVAGWRAHKQTGPDGEVMLGSLMLGLHDDDGVLHSVGVAASFTQQRRLDLVAELLPYVLPDGAQHPWQDWEDAEAHTRQQLPGAQSRWTSGKDMSWFPLRPELVVEVGYDAMEGIRFRHTAQFKRWRTDRTPESCTYQQLERPVTYSLDDVFTSAHRP